MAMIAADQPPLHLGLNTVKILGLAIVRNDGHQS
jgi:hypothetical protein